MTHRAPARNEHSAEARPARAAPRPPRGVAQARAGCLLCPPLLFLEEERDSCFADDGAASCGTAPACSFLGTCSKVEESQPHRADPSRGRGVSVEKKEACSRACGRSQERRNYERRLGRLTHMLDACHRLCVSMTCVLGEGKVLRERLTEGISSSKLFLSFFSFSFFVGVSFSISFFHIYSWDRTHGEKNGR